MRNVHAPNSVTDLPLFQVPPLSRTGQATSKQAEEGLRKSGVLSGQLAETLAALEKFIASNGYAPTTGELAQGDPARVHVMGRRLPSLVAVGLVAKGPERRCAQSSRNCTTWRIA